MKIKRKILIAMTAITVSTAFFGGCSVQSASEMQKKTQKKMDKNKTYRNAKNNTPANYRSEAFTISQKEIDVGFYKKPVADAMREVAQMLKIGFDESYIPAREYRISIEFTGTLGDFLAQVKNITGVSYKYRHNMLEVVNKQTVKRSHAEHICKVGQKPTIEISLNNVSPMEVFKYFSKKYGYNFTFNTKFYDVTSSGSSSKQPMQNTSLFYKGCDAKEALYTFLSSIDFSAKEIDKKSFIIQDYAMENIDIPTYFDYKYTSGQTLGSDSANGNDGSIVSTSENYKREFFEFLKKFMSTDGVLNISNRGYITIVDRPSKVQEVKRIIKTEIEKQTPMELSLSIVRV